MLGGLAGLRSTGWTPVKLRAHKIGGWGVEIAWLLRGKERGPVRVIKLVLRQRISANRVIEHHFIWFIAVINISALRYTTHNRINLLSFLILSSHLRLGQPQNWRRFIHLSCA